MNAWPNGRRRKKPSPVCAVHSVTRSKGFRRRSTPGVRLRQTLERERDEGAAKLAARDGELSELRLAFDRERAELQARLEARGSELAAFRIDSEREHDALK